MFASGKCFTLINPNLLVYPINLLLWIGQESSGVSTVHLNIVAGDVAAGARDHRLFPEWCPQYGASYGQEPIRNLCPGVLPLPPEVLVLWNAFLFQQGLDCCPFLPGLALDLFDLFACKHVS